MKKAYVYFIREKGYWRQAPRAEFLSQRWALRGLLRAGKAEAVDGMAWLKWEDALW